MENLVTAAEEYSKSRGLNAKNSMKLKLIAEETAQMIHMAGGYVPEKVSYEGDDSNCVIRLIFGTPKSRELVFDERIPGITGNISFLLMNSYDNLCKNQSEVEKIGMRKVKEEDLEYFGLDEGTEAFVWSIQAYSMVSYDKLSDNDSETWAEISRSIIANLADDVRVFVFRYRSEVSVLVSFKDKKDAFDKYGISPEFEALSRVPVINSMFQIKLVQLLYGRLCDVQKSTDKVKVIKHVVKADSSPKGKVTLLEYCPSTIQGTGKTPCILFLHGGATLFPVLPYQYKMAENFAEETGFKVFLLIYDLSPSNKPPVQIKEALDAYNDLINNAADYKIDPDKIAVLGDSDGGAMAAALCLLARDKNIKAPSCQVLLYPSLDNRKNSASMNSYTDVPFANKDIIKSYMDMIEVDEKEGKKYYMSPAEAESLALLPRAYVETAEFDAVHDEGVNYAKRLKDEKVFVCLNETSQTVHAFDMANDSAILKKAMEKRVEFIKTSML